MMSTAAGTGLEYVSPLDLLRHESLVWEGIMMDASASTAGPEFM